MTKRKLSRPSRRTIESNIHLLNLLTQAIPRQTRAIDICIRKLEAARLQAQRIKATTHLKTWERMVAKLLSRAGTERSFMYAVKAMMKNKGKVSESYVAFLCIWLIAFRKVASDNQILKKMGISMRDDSKKEKKKKVKDNLMDEASKKMKNYRHRKSVGGRPLYVSMISPLFKEANPKPMLPLSLARRHLDAENNDFFTDEGPAVRPDSCDIPQFRDTIDEKAIERQHRIVRSNSHNAALDLVHRPFATAFDASLSSDAHYTVGKDSLGFETIALKKTRHAHRQRAAGLNRRKKFRSDEEESEAPSDDDDSHFFRDTSQDSIAQEDVTDPSLVGPTYVLVQRVADSAFQVR